MVKFEWATLWDEGEEREGVSLGIYRKSGDGGGDAGGVGMNS